MREYNIIRGDDSDFVIIDSDNQSLVRSMGDSGEAKHRIRKVANSLERLIRLEEGINLLAKYPQVYGLSFIKQLRDERLTPNKEAE